MCNLALDAIHAAIAIAVHWIAGGFDFRLMFSFSGPWLTVFIAFVTSIEVWGLIKAKAKPKVQTASCAASSFPDMKMHEKQ